MTYHYTSSGLDYVYLANGYTVHETDYGPGVSIEHSDDLDLMISLGVLRSHARLRGQEVRFLRGLMDISQTALATLLGNKRITVQRWESHPKTKIPRSEDRLLRVLVAARLHGIDEAKDILDSLEEFSDDQPVKIVMHYRPVEVEPTLFAGEDEEIGGEQAGDDSWVPRLEAA